MSETSTVAVMDQMADSSVSLVTGAVQTPLAHARVDATSPGEARGAASESSVKLVENDITGLLVLRAGKAAQALSHSLDKHLDLALPERLQSTASPACCLRWMSPDEWLLSCPLQDCFSIEQSLRADASPIAVVNVSGGYSVLHLSGADAINVLKKSMAYDVHPDNLPAGKVVNTTLAKTQVTLRAMPDGAFELIVRRSYADYVWLWFQRAGAEYGLRALNRGSS